MVYSIKIARVDIGDTIIWKSVDKGHNGEFVEMPEGVEKFKTKSNLLPMRIWNIFQK